MIVKIIEYIKFKLKRQLEKVGTNGVVRTKIEEKEQERTNRKNGRQVWFIKIKCNRVKLKKLILLIKIQKLNYFRTYNNNDRYNFFSYVLDFWAYKFTYIMF